MVPVAASGLKIGGGVGVVIGECVGQMRDTAELVARGAQCRHIVRAIGQYRRMGEELRGTATAGVGQFVQGGGTRLPGPGRDPAFRARLGLDGRHQRSDIQTDGRGPGMRARRPTGRDPPHRAVQPGTGVAVVDMVGDLGGAEQQRRRGGELDRRRGAHRDPRGAHSAQGARSGGATCGGYRGLGLGQQREHHRVGIGRTPGQLSVPVAQPQAQAAHMGLPELRVHPVLRGAVAARP